MAVASRGCVLSQRRETDEREKREAENQSQVFGFDMFIVCAVGQAKTKSMCLRGRCRHTSQKLVYDWTCGYSMMIRHRFRMCKALGSRPSTESTRQSNRKARRTPKSFTLEIDGSE